MTNRKVPRKPPLGKPTTKGQVEREIDHDPEDAANTNDAKKAVSDDSFTIDQGRRLANDTPKSEAVPDRHPHHHKHHRR